jgi:hypothetical protein
VGWKCPEYQPTSVVFFRVFEKLSDIEAAIDSGGAR